MPAWDVPCGGSDDECEVCGKQGRKCGGRGRKVKVRVMVEHEVECDVSIDDMFAEIAALRSAESEIALMRAITTAHKVLAQTKYVIAAARLYLGLCEMLTAYLCEN